MFHHNCPTWLPVQNIPFEAMHCGKCYLSSLGVCDPHSNLILLGLVTFVCLTVSSPHILILPVIFFLCGKTKDILEVFIWNTPTGMILQLGWFTITIKYLVGKLFVLLADNKMFLVHHYASNVTCCSVSNLAHFTISYNQSNIIIHLFNRFKNSHLFQYFWKMKAMI